LGGFVKTLLFIFISCVCFLLNNGFFATLCLRGGFFTIFVFFFIKFGFIGVAFFGGVLNRPLRFFAEGGWLNL
uniref:hypothetical protein n=1 Tax=Salmonella enterica TaxID=28901 RepID=UPI0020C2F183